jgi:hypothetical protein
LTTGIRGEKHIDAITRKTKRKMTKSTNRVVLCGVELEQRARVRK